MIGTGMPLFESLRGLLARVRPQLPLVDFPGLSRAFNHAAYA
jgi:hypothetical protein